MHRQAPRIIANQSPPHPVRPGRRTHKQADKESENPDDQPHAEDNSADHHHDGEQKDADDQVSHTHQADPALDFDELPSGLSLRVEDSRVAGRFQPFTPL
jgi:hypothetical protein